MRRLLAADRRRDWPACAALLRRDAFVDEVARAVVALLTAAIDQEEVLAAARVTGDDGRWADLLAFVGRYRRHLAERGVIDADELPGAAAVVLRDPEIQRAESSRWAEVVVDDAEAMTPAIAVLMRRLCPANLTVAANPALAIGRGDDCSTTWLESGRWHRRIDLGPGRRVRGPGELVRCHHQAVESEAVAGVLLDARDGGVPWTDMAVLVRRDRERARSLGRALVRHGIPVRPAPGHPAEEPAVRAIADFFAWALGDDNAFARLLASPAVDANPGDARRLRAIVRAGGSDPRLTRLEKLRDRLVPRIEGGDPGALIFEVWRTLLPGLVPDPDAGSVDPATVRALEAVASFVSGVARRTARHPAWTLADELALLDGPDFGADPWRPTSIGPTDAVSISTIVGAAGASGTPS